MNPNHVFFNVCFFTVRASAVPCRMKRAADSVATAGVKRAKVCPSGGGSGRTGGGRSLVTIAGRTFQKEARRVLAEMAQRDADTADTAKTEKIKATATTPERWSIGKEARLELREASERYVNWLLHTAAGWG